MASSHEAVTSDRLPVSSSSLLAYMPDYSHNILRYMSPYTRRTMATTSYGHLSSNDSFELCYFRSLGFDTVMGKAFAGDEIVPMREMMGATGALISGRTALELFDVRYFATTAVEFYVDSRRAQGVVGWLQAIGFAFMPPVGWEDMLRDVPDDVSATTDQGVELLMKHWRVQWPDISTPGAGGGDGGWVRQRLHFQRNGIHVELCATYDTPIRAILCFPLTSMMNFVDCDHAYSLFPYSTFHERIAFVVSSEQEYVLHDIQRTISDIEFTLSHGWTIDGGDYLGYPTTMPLPIHVPEERARTERWIGDKCNWKFPIGSSPVQITGLSQWQLRTSFRWIFFRFTESRCRDSKRLHAFQELCSASMPCWSKDHHAHRESLTGCQVLVLYEQHLLPRGVEMRVIDDFGDDNPTLLRDSESDRSRV